jgi:hypothetical protein
VLDPENGKLESCRRQFGNGVVSTNRTHDIVDFSVIQLSKGILVAQELFVVKGHGNTVGEAKNVLEPFNDNVLAFVGPAAGSWV